MTTEEIVKLLRCCEDGECGGCPLHSDKQRCQERLLGSAADLIERLEKEKAALLEYAKKSAGCEQCANYRPRCECEAEYRDILCTENCPCQTCRRGSKWEWKGLEADE